MNGNKGLKYSGKPNTLSVYIKNIISLQVGRSFVAFSFVF